MGYDLHVIDRQGLASYDEAPDAYFEDFQVGGYLRRNIWGMGELLTAMDEVGLLDTSVHCPPSSAWPQYARTGDDEADGAAYREAARPILAARSSDPCRIPAYKFCSNDGWIITPEECRMIAGRLAEHPERHVREFAAYCAFAGERGGFTVD